MKRLLSAILDNLVLSSKSKETPHYRPRHDIEKFETLRTHINTTGKRVVSVDMFFDGNWDLGSIGCNLIDHPGIATFYETLKSIEARDDVEQVWMGITDWQPDDLSTWAFCDHVFVIGTFDPAEMIAILKPLEPDRMEPEWYLTSPRDNAALDENAKRFVGLPNRLNKGQKMITVFWD